MYHGRGYIGYSAFKLFFFTMKIALFIIFFLTLNVFSTPVPVNNPAIYAHNLQEPGLLRLIRYFTGYIPPAKSALQVAHKNECYYETKALVKRSLLLWETILAGVTFNDIVIIMTNPDTKIQDLETNYFKFIVAEWGRFIRITDKFSNPDRIVNRLDMDLLNHVYESYHTYTIYAMDCISAVVKVPTKTSRNKLKVDLKKLKAMWTEFDNNLDIIAKLEKQSLMK